MGEGEKTDVFDDLAQAAGEQESSVGKADKLPDWLAKPGEKASEGVRFGEEKIAQLNNGISQFASKEDRKAFELKLAAMDVSDDEGLLAFAYAERYQMHFPVESLLAEANLKRVEGGLGVVSNRFAYENLTEYEHGSIEVGAGDTVDDVYKKVQAVTRAWENDEETKVYIESAILEAKKREAEGELKAGDGQKLEDDTSSSEGLDEEAGGSTVEDLTAIDGVNEEIAKIILESGIDLHNPTAPALLTHLKEMKIAEDRANQAIIAMFKTGNYFKGEGRKGPDKDGKLADDVPDWLRVSEEAGETQEERESESPIQGRRNVGGGEEGEEAEAGDAEEMLTPHVSQRRKPGVRGGEPVGADEEVVEQTAGDKAKQAVGAAVEEIAQGLAGKGKGAEVVEDDESETERIKKEFIDKFGELDKEIVESYARKIDKLRVESGGDFSITAGVISEEANNLRGIQWLQAEDRLFHGIVELARFYLSPELRKTNPQVTDEQVDVVLKFIKDLAKECLFWSGDLSKQKEMENMIGVFKKERDKRGKI